MDGEIDRQSTSVTLEDLVERFHSPISEIWENIKKNLTQNFKSRSQTLHFVLE